VTALAYGSSTVKRRRRTGAELDVVDDAILSAAAEENPATVRGVFYRVESTGAVEKTDNGYRLIGRRVLKLRRDGRLPYAWITDGTRWVSKPTTWTDLDEMLDDAGASYRRALWHDQHAEVRVFTEKDAISGVLSPVTDRWDVPLGVVRGYASESFLYSIAENIAATEKPVFLYQFGDHDPSGLDAWRHFRERVKEFLTEMAPTGSHGRIRLWTTGQINAIVAANENERLEVVDGEALDLGVHFQRLAVTEAQIEDYALHTRPTKRTDTRSRDFYGESVEVDAVRPSTLRELAEAAITQHIDAEALRLTLLAEQSERDLFERMRVGGAS
jgi:hypothetical protein